MYSVSSLSGLDQCISPTGDGPLLKSDDKFWKVIETIPEDEFIPMPVVKLGLLTGQLESLEEHSTIYINHNNTTYTEVPVLPETLKRVRWLLHELAPTLNKDLKKDIGSFCNKTGLNRPPSEGCNLNEVKNLSKIENINDHIELDLKEKTNTKNKKKESSENSDPITGRPELNTNLLNDTKLHQGGG